MNIMVSDGFLKPLRPIGGSAVSVATPCSDLQCQRRFAGLLFRHMIKK